MALTVAFWLLALLVVFGALGVVILRNVFHAALSLILCFIGVAGLFITLSADFLAAVQILIYVGAIGVVIILAIMLTRDVTHASTSNRLRIPAFVVAAAFLGITIYSMVTTSWPVSNLAPAEPTTLALAGRFLGDGGYLLALEIAPVLLLVAVLGAIVIVRDK